MWSLLPYDIITELANRLDPIEDFLAFSHVCTSWKSLYLDKAWNSSPKIPWLILDTYVNGEQCFSFTRHKILKTPSANVENRRIWGSSHGWLVMMTPDYLLQVFDPITGRKVDVLPVSSALGNVKGVFWFDLIHQASVLKVGADYLLVVIYGPRNRLAYSKLGTRKWNTVISNLIYTSVVSYKGRLLGLSMCGTLAVIETDEGKQPTTGKCFPPPVGLTGWKKLYLAESCDDLLLVCHKPRQVLVYKFDLVAYEWKRIESLGDRVLFADEYNCISASSCVDAAYYKEDCIYFAEDYLEGFPYPGWDRRNYIHVYDMKRNFFVKLFLKGDRSYSRYRCPVWLIPSLWK